MKKEFKNAAVMFCTDYLFEQDEELDNVESYEVIMAVLNKVFKGVEPTLSKKYLRRYYNNLIEFTQEMYNEYHKKDRRSETSAENGKKGGRPPKASQPDSDDGSKVVNCNGREAEKKRKEKLIFERIATHPDRYKNGSSWESICIDFDDIEPYSDRLLNTLESLNSEGKIKMQKLNDYTFSIRLLEAV